MGSMNRLFVYITLVAVLLVQTHGWTHTVDYNGHLDQNCSICEFLSHDQGVTPDHSTLEVVFLPKVQFLLFTSHFVSTKSLFMGASPRSPPRFS